MRSRSNIWLWTAKPRQTANNSTRCSSALREAVLARDVPGASSRILDPAEVPWDPVLPRKNRNFAMGVSGRRSAGAGARLCSRDFQHRVTSPD